MLVRFAGRLVLAILVSSSAWAADPPGSATAGGNSDIVVKGVGPHAMDTYVRQAITSGDRGQLARWNRPICTRVINLDAVHADAVENRIASIARAVHAGVAAKPCKANVLIIATTDPDGAVKQIRDDYPRLFLFRDNGDRPAADYEDLLKPEPVRWINASERLSADGVAIGNGTLAESSLAGSNLPTNTVREPGGIDTTTREDSAISIAVIDANKLANIGTGQLADYMAMVVLGNPRFGAPFKGDTIMAMFADRDAGAAIPEAMTSMDLSLLQNLYSTANLRTADQQRASIEYRMRHPTIAAKVEDGADKNR